MNFVYTLTVFVLLVAGCGQRGPNVSDQDSATSSLAANEVKYAKPLILGRVNSANGTDIIEAAVIMSPLGAHDISETQNEVEFPISRVLQQLRNARMTSAHAVCLCGDSYEVAF